MKIKQSKCKLCGEKTDFGFIYYDKTIPICLRCINFIKKLNIGEFLE